MQLKNRKKIKIITMATDLFYKNAKAYFNYQIEAKDIYLAGLVLDGMQVKAIRSGKINITEAFCRVINNEVFLFNVVFDGHAYNDIKMLLNKKEIKDIAEDMRLKNTSLIPLNLSFQRYAKMQIGLGKGKKNHQKKQTIIERDAKREIKKYV